MEKLRKLMELWYSLMLDHHKDRDCHVYIQADVKYDGQLTWSANHYGYIADEWTSPEFPLMETAIKYACMELNRMIRRECSHIIPNEEYSKAHREQAEKVLVALQDLYKSVSP